MHADAFLCRLPRSNGQENRSNWVDINGFSHPNRPDRPNHTSSDKAHTSSKVYAFACGLGIISRFFSKFESKKCPNLQSGVKPVTTTVCVFIRTVEESSTCEGDITTMTLEGPIYRGSEIALSQHMHAELMIFFPHDAEITYSR